ncbi:GGDEF domain-containing protein [Thermoleophilum album]|uniref:Diguanylate cyclase, GGDEF domain n=1 Tax=Thermoleophilum album TaxID=29539 RepID=A0A1H6FKG1_THEAL|nr:diguanylate cyclase [Thermoleophilum album]SEH10323.1 Diguanylate cyclase, GGDEF domain [Thermoleophilum album]
MTRANRPGRGALARGREALDPRRAETQQALAPRPDNPLDDLRPVLLDPSGTGLRMLALLFLAGGVLGLLSLALPRNPHARLAVLVGLALAAIAASGYLWQLGRRSRPTWVTLASLLFGCLLVAMAVANDQAASAYGLFFVWVAVSAFLLLRRRLALLVLSVAAGAYAAALALAVGGGVGRGGSEAQRWLVTVGTAAVAGFLVGALRERAVTLTERLSGAAHTDPLTGLLNRRGFDAVLDREVERSRRSGRPLSVVFGDVDGLKGLNDAAGHDAGDAALVAIARAIWHLKRRIDVGARFGGDEFALVLPEADAAGALVVAERIRRGVTSAAAVPPGLTISFGVACLPTDTDNRRDLLRAADRALYAAKQAGRDRTKLAAELPPAPPVTK